MLLPLLNIATHWATRRPTPRTPGGGRLVVDFVLVDAIIDVTGIVVRWWLDPRWPEVEKSIQHPRRSMGLSREIE